MDVTEDRAHRAWRVAERVARLSDNLIPIGPWGIGLDGVLAWVPGANTLYSVGAGGLLFYEGIAAGASAGTLVRMGLYLVANSALTEIPVIGWAMDTLFRGHLMAARALQKDIARRFGPAEMGPEWRRGRGERREAVRVIG
ncbi:MAG: hypothetical protein JWO88_3857 [Frankiales bacterium]|nr:hypothetical protein [Frankiales bacterium]